MHAPFATVCLALLALTSCKKDAQPTANEPISEEIQAQVKAWGFGTSTLQKHEDGYLVEGDIILTPEMLASAPTGNVLRIGNEEQYHTTYVVNESKHPVITVSLSSKFPSSYIAALDEALARYNNVQNFDIEFVRTSGDADIDLVTAGGNYLASAGFPSSTGDPYGQVKVNVRAIGNQPLETVATILAHEIGHCIGYRHTDFFNRSVSCGGAPTNEGASTVGAIHIPGTPSNSVLTVDRGSWMLSCIGSGQNRPFTSNDVTALTYLY